MHVYDYYYSIDVRFNFIPQTFPVESSFLSKNSKIATSSLIIMTIGVACLIEKVNVLSHLEPVLQPRAVD